MIVVYCSTYVKQGTDLLRYNFQCLDPEEQCVRQIFVDASKVQHSERLRNGSIIDVIYKPGFNNTAVVSKVIISEDHIDSFDLN